MTARRRTARRDELTELVKERLHSGFYFPELLDGEVLDDDDLADLWQQHREDVLATYTPPSYALDQPCWAEYVFELAPNGPRRGVDPEAQHFGYNADERDAEPWREYLRRCRIAR